MLACIEGLRLTKPQSKDVRQLYVSHIVFEPG